jgi:hypothetical protein
VIIGTALGGIVASISGFAGAVGAGLALITSPFALVIGAVALLYLAWTQNWFGIRDKAAEVWNWLKTEVSNLVTNLQERYNNLTSRTDTLKTQFSNAWQSLVTLYNTIKTALVTAVTNLYNDLQNRYTQIKTACQALYIDWQQKWNNIKTHLTTTTSNIKTTLQGWYNDAQNRFTQVKTALLGLYIDWKKKWDDIYNYVVTKKTDIVNKVKGIATDVQNLAGYFWNAGASILNSLKASVTEGFTRVINTAKEKLKTLKSYLPNSPAKAGPFRELPYWGDVIPGPIEDALKATDPLVSKLSNTLGKLRSPLDNLRDPTASINGGLSNISSVTNNSNSSSNVTYEIHMENHLSNDVDMNKFVREFQKIIKLQGQQGGYF